MKSTALPRDFRTWLNRPSHIGPKQRQPLRRISKRRQRQGREYTTKRKEFLARNPWCAVSPALFGRRARATEIHHRHGRVGLNYLDESTWLPVCREAHRWIHDNPADARRRGWLV